MSAPWRHLVGGGVIGGANIAIALIGDSSIRVGSSIVFAIAMILVVPFACKVITARAQARALRALARGEPTLEHIVTDLGTAH